LAGDEGEGDPLGPRWSTEHVFSESERVARQELARTKDPFVIAELLRVLGLEWSASAADIDEAHKQLAKLHHPDLHHDADAATRAHHVEQMQRVNNAYEALRQLDDFR
jgi:preprotein translocase subunit Sec63